jgi:hypothetical protein
MGIDIKEARNTKRKLLNKNEDIIFCSEIPNTFLIPISFVLVRTINKVRPNNPEAAIRIAIIA